MTDKEQIQEMAKVLGEIQEFGINRPRDEERYPVLYPSNKEVADYLISKGYRKVERGEWIETVHDWDFGDYTDYRCSICGTREQNKRLFCPNCGADMRGEENERV